MNIFNIQTIQTLPAKFLKFNHFFKVCVFLSILSLFRSPETAIYDCFTVSDMYAGTPDCYHETVLCSTC